MLKEPLSFDKWLVNAKPLLDIIIEEQNMHNHLNLQNDAEYRKAYDMYLKVHKEAFIAKVQLSQFTNQPNQGALIYNEARNLEFETYNAKEVTDMKNMLGGRQKGYFMAILEEGKFVFIGPAEDQDW